MSDDAQAIPSAMILAAGRGERMRPLTDSTPKPLLKVKGKALIDYHLERLSAAGVSYVVINVCWLGHLIKAHVGNGQRYGLQVDYSEEEVALETAGGIALALRRFETLAQGEFLLFNADVYSSNPLPQLLDITLGDKYGHLLLTDTPNYLPGDFRLMDGLVHRREQGSHDTVYTYTGAARYSPSWFAACPQGPYPMRPLFDDAIDQKRLSGSLLNGQWLDVGTPERLQLAENTVR